MALSAVLAAAAAGLLLNIARSAKVFRSAIAHRHETLGAAQNRLFGAAYMVSIRKIREEVDVDETLFLVDAQCRNEGAHYFVLNLLAPRRIVLLGDLREQSLRALQRRLPPRARWVVTVGQGRAPPILETAEEFRAR